MAKKKKKVQKKRVKTAAKKAAKKPAAEKKEAKPAKEQKVVVTAQLRRIWLRVRKSYDMSLRAFSNALSVLSDDEAEMLYDLVRHSLYKGNPAQIIRAHPQMKEFVRSDKDRRCMFDIYENLSWRLGKSEPMPKDRALISRFRKAVKGNVIIQ